MLNHRDTCLDTNNYLVWLNNSQTLKVIGRMEKGKGNDGKNEVWWKKETIWYVKMGQRWNPISTFMALLIVYLQLKFHLIMIFPTSVVANVSYLLTWDDMYLMMWHWCPYGILWHHHVTFPCLLNCHVLYPQWFPFIFSDLGKLNVLPLTKVLLELAPKTNYLLRFGYHEQWRIFLDLFVKP
jgi:hypothetical protein